MNAAKKVAQSILFTQTGECNSYDIGRSVFTCAFIANDIIEVPVIVLNSVLLFALCSQKTFCLAGSSSLLACYYILIIAVRMIV